MIYLLTISYKLIVFSMIIIPDMNTIVQYVLNGLLSLIIFFFILRPILKITINSASKITGVKEDIKLGSEQQVKKSSNTQEKKINQKQDNIKKQNLSIHEQAEKEVEEMENKVISKLFDGNT